MAARSPVLSADAFSSLIASSLDSAPLDLTFSVPTQSSPRRASWLPSRASLPSAFKRTRNHSTVGSLPPTRVDDGHLRTDSSTSAGLAPRRRTASTPLRSSQAHRRASSVFVAPRTTEPWQVDEHGQLAPPSTPRRRAISAGHRSSPRGAPAAIGQRPVRHVPRPRSLPARAKVPEQPASEGVDERREVTSGAPKSAEQLCVRCRQELGGNHTSSTGKAAPEHSQSHTNNPSAPLPFAKNLTARLRTLSSHTSDPLKPDTTLSTPQQATRCVSAPLPALAPSESRAVRRRSSAPMGGGPLSLHLETLDEDAPLRARLSSIPSATEGEMAIPTPVPIAFPSTGPDGPEPKSIPRRSSSFSLLRLRALSSTHFSLGRRSPVPSTPEPAVAPSTTTHPPSPLTPAHRLSRLSQRLRSLSSTRLRRNRRSAANTDAHGLEDSASTASTPPPRTPTLSGAPASSGPENEPKAARRRSASADGRATGASHDSPMF